MRLEAHDTYQDDPVRPGMSAPTHSFTLHLDFDYQAEMEVDEMGKAESAEHLVKWILMDERGTRAVWERREGKPELIAKADRFGGEWKPLDSCIVLP